VTPKPRSAAGAPAQPDLSVVIVNRNTRALLRACLESLAIEPDQLSIQVIVVDNGSEDGSAEMVAHSFPEAVLLRNAGNTGFAFPNNQGLAESTGRYVMLLNSDTEVRPGALATLVRFMDSHPDAGACGPLLRYPDGRVQPSCSSFPTPWAHFCDITFLDRLFPRSRRFAGMITSFAHDRTALVEQPAGAALLVRREAIEQVGALDERFAIYYNDVDWCYRIHLAGWKICFVHDAEVIHHQGVTTRNENRELELTREMVRNRLDYFSKHFGERGEQWFRVSSLIGFAAREAVFGIPAALLPSPRTKANARYRREMLRLVWKGRPPSGGTPFPNRQVPGAPAGSAT
jgi:GT2 family glycosyltransferase